MFLLEEYQSNLVDVSNYNSIYEIMEESELAVHDIFKSLYQIDNETILESKEDKEYTDVKYSETGEQKSPKSNSRFKIVGDKLKKAVIAIKDAFLKVISMIKNTIKGLYNKIFGEKTEADKKALENKTPIKYKGYDIIKYSKKEFISPKYFCGYIETVMRDEKLTVKTIDYLSYDRAKKFKDRINERIEDNQKLTKWSTLADDMLGKVDIHEVTSKQVYSSIKNKFSNFDNYLNKATQESTQICENMIREISQLWYNIDYVKKEYDQESAATKLIIEIYNNMMNGLKRCQAQYTSYLQAEVNLLSYMRKLYGFIIRKAAGIIDNKSEDNKEENKDKFEEKCVSLLDTYNRSEIIPISLEDYSVDLVWSSDNP